MVVLKNAENPTVREYFRPRLRVASITFFIGWAGFAVSSISGSNGVDGAYSFQMPFFALAGIAVLFHGFAFRCPRCHGNLGFTFQRGGNWFAVGRKVQYCPFCGLNFDLERMGSFGR